MPKTAKSTRAQTRYAYRINEVAAFLGVHRWTVEQLIRDGYLDTSRVPGRRAIWIPAASLDRFLEDNAQRPAS